MYAHRALTRIPHTSPKVPLNKLRRRMRAAAADIESAALAGESAPLLINGNARPVMVMRKVTPYVSPPPHHARIYITISYVYLTYLDDCVL